MAKAKKKKASVKGERRFSKISEVRIQWVPDSVTIPLQTQEPPPLLNRDRYSKVGV